jgi:hypothetical protein
MGRDAHAAAPPPDGRAGEVVAVGALWLVTLAAVVATYARIDPAELYHVSGSGLTGGLSRALVLLNFPIALVAIGAALLALGRLPRRAWWVGGPALSLCAVTAWPGVVDQGDLDARPVNALPAIGVVLAVGLSLAALRGSAVALAPRRALDRARIAVGLTTLVVSIPWLAAELGLFLPDGLFLMRKPGLEADGTPLPAVHLGHHHGLDGALILVSALLLSRSARGVGALAGVTRAYLGLALAYGAVNATQDAWNEQLVKRGTVDWKIPSALLPRLTPVWLVVLGLAVLCTLALRWEATRTARSRSG